MDYFIQGYMDKEAVLGEIAEGAGHIGSAITGQAVEAFKAVPMVAAVLLGTTAAGAASAGGAVGYISGRTSDAGVSDEVLKKRLRKQELRELEKELAFNKNLSKYRSGKEEKDVKEIRTG